MLALAAFFACFLALGAAWADERRAVEVHVAGPEARTERMSKALDEPLHRLPADIWLQRSDAVDPKSIVDPSGPRGDAFVRVWVDLGAPDRVTVYFVDESWERILVRRVPLEKDLDDVELEEVAQIVRSAVEALLGGAKLGITREEAREQLLPAPEPTPPVPVPAPPPPQPKKPEPSAPEPRPKPPIPSPSLPKGKVGAFYEAELYEHALWHGPGLVAGADARGQLAWGGRLTLQYRTPLTIEGQDLGAKIQGLSLRGLGRGSWTDGGFSAALAAGFGLDLTHTDPVSLGPNAVPGSPRWDVVPVARVLGGVGIDAGGVEIWPVLGLDLDLVGVRYVAEGPTGKDTVRDVSRLRPFFGLELVLPVDHD